MRNITVVTGASSGFGALAARALALAGHTVYASMRETTGRNAPQVKEVEEYANAHSVDLHAVELDVLSQESTDAALKTIVSENDRLDVVIHNAGSPNDKARAAEYDSGANKGLADQIQKGLAATEPPDADVAAVADAIVKVVDMPLGKRPFRIHIDPAQDGCEVVNAVADHIRTEFLRWIGLGDLLSPRVND